jgi:hypothetical protein
MTFDYGNPQKSLVHFLIVSSMILFFWKNFTSKKKVGVDRGPARTSVLCRMDGVCIENTFWL